MSIIFGDQYPPTLSKKEIKRLDELYSRDYSQSIKNAMYEYSEDSEIVNKAFRENNGKWNEYLTNKFGLTEKEFKQIHTSLDNSQIPLVGRTTLNRGLKKM